MELVKQVSEMVYEDAKEVFKGIMVISFISNFTGYKPDDLDDKEVIDELNQMSTILNAICDSILEKMDMNELKELLEQKENMARFKRELHELMKKTEDW